MKIGPQGTGDDLLARMQEAAESAKSDKVGKDFSVDQTDPGTRTDGTAATVEAAEPVSSLNQRLKVTASNALEGSVDNPNALRAEVVEIVVDEKYTASLTVREKRSLTKNLKAALVDDPTFKREVDSMLLMAAREIGKTRG